MISLTLPSYVYALHIDPLIGKYLSGPIQRHDHDSNAEIRIHFTTFRTFSLFLAILVYQPVLFWFITIQPNHPL